AVAVGECVEAVVARAHASMHPEDGLSVCDEPQDAERDRAQSDSEDLLPAVHQGCPARVSERACDRVTGATGRTPTTSAGAYCAGLSTVLPGEEYLGFWYPLINISSRCSFPNRSDNEAISGSCVWVCRFGSALCRITKWLVVTCRSPWAISAWQCPCIRSWSDAPRGSRLSSHGKTNGGPLRSSSCPS